MTNEWIKVGDKLPGEKNWYLVWEREQVNFLYYDSENNWLDINHDYEWPHKITHWMPLPDKPIE